MKCLEPNLLIRRILLIPLGDTRVEIPAVIIEGLRSLLAFLNEPLNISERAMLEMLESDNYIGYLNACIVDVILHVDVVIGGAQKSDERVTQNCVPQVSYMSGFIGVDARVLN